MASKALYVKIAGILAGDLATSNTARLWNKVRGITLSIADAFAQDNPLFDRAKFYEASGLEKDGSLPLPKRTPETYSKEMREAFRQDPIWTSLDKAMKAAMNDLDVMRARECLLRLESRQRVIAKRLEA